MTTPCSLLFFILFTLLAVKARATADGFTKVEQLEWAKKSLENKRALNLSPPPQDILKKERIPVILSKGKKVWDLQQNKMILTLKDLHLEIYNHPDQQNFYFVYDPTHPQERLYKVHIEDLTPLHPIDHIKVEPENEKIYDRIPLYNQAVPPRWFLETHLSFGFQRLNNKKLDTTKKSSSLMRSIEGRVLFAGISNIQVGGDFLFRQSFFVSKNKNFDQKSFYFGPMARFSWGPLQLHGEVLKSFSSLLTAGHYTYHFDNFLIQGGLEYCYSQTSLIGIGLYREIYQLSDEFKNRPQLKGMSSSGFYIHIGYNWSGFIL